MPIILPPDLPAAAALRSEGLAVVEPAEGGAGEPPLRIALVNIMPKKASTETQIARLLASTTQTVSLTLMLPDGYRPKTTSSDHIDAHYTLWSESRHEPFDGVIITGAPIETLDFEEVHYWPAMTEILEWAAEETSGSLNICWAGQASLYHFHGVPKHQMSEKCFGVYRQQVAAKQASVLDGFGESFPVPVSRYTETLRDDLPEDGGVEVLAESPESGLCLIEDRPRRALHMFNHWEYDATTLVEEYERDRKAGLGTALPENAFPDDDPAQAPLNSWRPYGRLFFGNWLEALAERRGEAREALDSAKRSKESRESSCSSTPSATRTGRSKPCSPCFAGPV